jgi:hypothetical protein
MLWHFGNGVGKNIPRAIRYYDAAIQQSNRESNHLENSDFLNILYASPGRSITDSTFTHSKTFQSLLYLLRWLALHDDDQSVDHLSESSSGLFTLLEFFHYPLNFILKTVVYYNNL